MTDTEKIEELVNRNAIRSGDMNLKRDFQEAITFGREESRKDTDEEWRMAVGWGNTVTRYGDGAVRQSIEAKNYKLLEALLSPHKPL